MSPDTHAGFYFFGSKTPYAVASGVGVGGNGEGVLEEEAMVRRRKLIEAKGLRARNSNLSNKATMKHDTWKTGIWSGTTVDTIFNYLSANFPKIEDATKVNVNKASAKDFETRLGFTAKEAEAIVVYRNEHGDFNWGEMLVIYGVDGKKVDAVHERMSF